MSKVAIIPTKRPILGVPPGTEVMVPGWQARILVAVNAAKYPDRPDDGEQERVTKPAQPAKRGRPAGSKNKPNPDKPKRPYKRRDMRAEE